MDFLLGVDFGGVAGKAALSRHDMHQPFKALCTNPFSQKKAVGGGGFSDCVLSCGGGGRRGGMGSDAP
jgi:hypothetical protein